MKNKNKNIKNSNHDEVIERKIKTMNKGKNYYNEVDQNNENEDNKENKNQ